MAWLTWAGTVRVLKPVAAGVALAYLGTGFVDGPPPVNFRADGPGAAKQAEIVEPQAELVIERNILKLGSLLTFRVEDPVQVRRQGLAGDGDMFYDPGLTGGGEVKGEVADTPESGQ
ncbi:hypothetical protein DND132_2814 [Pseudodesulfovibrio mercurii]|uniref:Uncharacterized protein n=1 Tax=Pseudodesulfovibrio mercurii TaxID=641491 RepID=F0JJB8_9BACT|nr:hypothetical protein [Pseudodesulfovibrio mercurii]EGB16017.1 hypothetical protein DND132_2814 [Pseudodesulfovibrio mercurii]